MFQGAKVPGRELARVVLELLLWERIGPGVKWLGTTELHMSSLPEYQWVILVILWDMI